MEVGDKLHVSFDGTVKSVRNHDGGWLLVHPEGGDDRFLALVPESHVTLMDNLRFETPAQRAAAWRFVIESLVGGMSDEGIVKWINTHGPDIGAMWRDAQKVRDGMIAT